VGSKRATSLLLIEFLREQGIHEIGEPEWLRIRQHFTGVSDRTLRKHARNSGLPLSPLVEGVRQGTLEDLERTLLSLGTVYASALAAGDQNRARECRRLVIQSKEHAQWNLRRAAPSEDENERQKVGEKILWMRTWLEDPILFPDWLQLRQRFTRGPGSDQHPQG
jgi:hypothetical protein